MPQPQPEDGATYSPKIDKADAQIDWRKPAIEIERMVRAYIPWPGTQTLWNGQMVKVLKAQVMRERGIGEIRESREVERWIDRGGDGRGRARLEGDSIGRAQGNEGGRLRARAAEVYRGGVGIEGRRR